MADAKTLDQANASHVEPYVEQTLDVDPVETDEWLESLSYVLKSKGPERIRYLLTVLEQRARQEGVDLPIASNTPYINTIHVDHQPPYPGNR